MIIFLANISEIGSDAISIIVNVVVVDVAVVVDIPRIVGVVGVRRRKPVIGTKSNKQESTT